MKDAAQSIDILALEVRRQADHLFPKRTDASMFLKLYSEIGELIDAPTDETEYADAMIMLLDYGARKRFSIEECIRRKMAVNDARVWLQSELGVMKHVK
jgi:hypothetical protein